MTTRTAHLGAEQFLPAQGDVAHLRRAAARCRGCDLWQHSTQTAFGEARRPAELMLVGETPGDHEDLRLARGLL